MFIIFGLPKYHMPVFSERLPHFGLGKLNSYSTDTAVNFNSVRAGAVNGIVPHVFSLNSCFKVAQPILIFAPSLRDISMIFVALSPNTAP